MTHGRVAVVAAAVLLAGACARQGAPTGGPQDRIPPVVVSVEPDTFAVVEPGVDELRIRFNERISERTSGGRLEDAVQISPEVPEIEVSHDRAGLDVKIPGGLEAGVTYAIRVRPVIRDMFGNDMVAPFEWVVSTGGSFTPNAVVGQVWDRLTGESLGDIRVVLTPGTDSRPGEPQGDTVRYTATTGQEGLYALRYVQPGPFQLLAFQDRDADRALDSTEAFGRASGQVGEADTVFLSLPVLVPDTSPAILAGADPVDSTVVRLRFDDALDPEAPLDEVTFDLVPDSGVTVPDTVVLPEVARPYHEFRWARLLDSTRTAVDSTYQARLEALRAAGDTAAADSLRAAGPPPIPGGTDRGPERSGARPAGDRLPDGSPMPSNTLVVVLDGPLPANLGLEIQVSGVVNLNGLPGGGGSAALQWAPAVDSAAAAPDSAAAPGAGAAPDTLAVPDTAVATPPDTAGTGLPARPGRRLRR